MAKGKNKPVRRSLAILVAIPIICLAFGAVVGWGAHGVVSRQISTKDFYCNGFVFTYPAIWHTGNTNGPCMISNFPHEKWPGISGMIDEGGVEISAQVAEEGLSEGQTLAEYVDTIKANALKSDGELDFVYESAEVEEVTLDHGTAYKLTATGGHYNRTEVSYYYASSSSVMWVGFTVNAGDKSPLHEQALDVVKSIRYSQS
jgi:hypothetical protein